MPDATTNDRDARTSARALDTDAGWERYRLHAEICRVLTDPKRLVLIDVLRTGERSVGELAEVLGCTLANASQHLAVLRSAGLVASRRSGTTIHYHLAEPRIVDACEVIQQIVERRLAGAAGGRATSRSGRDATAPAPATSTAGHAARSIA
jgi:ArsR family transcriptional regulator, virulence genes transcriptional regulator